MDIKRLEAYIKIVDLGSLRGAAAHLNISQPSLSQVIKDLEHYFGKQLLVRTKRGVAATDAGMLLYRHAHHLVKQLDQARHELTRTSDDIRGSVSLGLAGMIAPALSVPLVQRVRAALPFVKLIISEGSHAQIAEMTLNGRLDLAVSTGVGVHGLTGEVVIEEELVVLLDQAMADRLPDRALSLDELAGIPMCLATHAGIGMNAPSREIVLDLSKLDVVAEFDSARDLIRAVEIGIGPAVIGEFAVRHLAGHLPTRRFSPPLRRDVRIWTAAGMPMSVPALHVKSILQDLIARPDGAHP